MSRPTGTRMNIIFHSAGVVNPGEIESGSEDYHEERTDYHEDDTDYRGGGKR